MPKYTLNGKSYNIPDSLAGKFESQNPSATIAYSANGKNYNIPVNKRDAFLKAFPDATMGEGKAKQAKPAEQQVQQPQQVEQEVQAKPQQVQQAAPTQIPQGFGQLDTNQANQIGLGKGPVSWEQAQQEPKEESVVEKTQRIMSGKATGKEQKQIQKRLQQRQDEIAYKEETGDVMKQPVLNPEWEAPTLSRDEYGNVNRDENGKPILGFSTDQDIVSSHQQTSEELERNADAKTLEEQAKIRLDEVNQRMKELGYDDGNGILDFIKDAFTIAQKGGLAKKIIGDNIRYAQELISGKAGLKADKAQLEYGLQLAKDAQIDANLYDDDDTWIEKAGKWLGRAYQKTLGTALKQSTWDNGRSELEKQFAIYRAMVKDDNNVADEDDKKLLNDAALVAAMNGAFDEGLSSSTKAGLVTGESLPFMLEMVVSRGGALGPKMAEQYMKYAIKKRGAKWVRDHMKQVVAKKIATRLAGDVVASHAMAGTTGSLRTLANTYERMHGDIKTGVDDKGNIIYNGHEVGDSAFDAFSKAWRSTAIENWSEMAGEYLPVMTGFFGNAIGKAAIGKAGRQALKLTGNLEDVGLNKAQKFIYDVAANKGIGAFSKGFGEFAKRAQWHGVVGEYAEEVLGNLANALTVGDQTLDNAKDTGVFNLQQNIDTFLGVALMGGFMSSIQTGAFARDKWNNRMSKIDKKGAGMFDDWNEIKDGINAVIDDDQALNSTLSVYLNNNSLSKDEKKVILDYTSKLMEQKGAEMYEYKPRMNSTSTEQKDGKYIVTAFDAFGNPIDQQEFDTQEDASAYQGELKMQQQSQDLKDYLHMSGKIGYSESSDLIDEFLSANGYESASDEKKAEMMASIQDTNTELGQKFLDFRKEKAIQKAQSSQAAIAAFEEEQGWTPGTVKWLSEQDPMELGEEGLQMQDQAREFLKGLAYPDTEVHTEISAQDGTEIADDVVENVASPTEPIDPNDNKAQQLTEQWNTAQAARQQLFDNDTTGNLKDEVESMEARGFTPQEILSTLDWATPEQRQVLVNYYNTKAKHDAYMFEAARKINEVASLKRQQHTFKGTINGNKDEQNLITITDGENAYTLVSGNITTDPSTGQVTGSDSGLIMALDENGDIVQLSDTSQLAVQPSGMTLDQYEAQQVEELGQGVTMVTDPTGSLSQPAPETAETGTNDVEPVPETEEEGTQQPAIERIPKDEQGNYLYEKAAPEDTYDALVEQVGEQSAPVIAKKQLDSAQKRHDKLVKDLNEGKIPGNTLQEQIEGTKKMQQQIAEEEERIKYWNSVLAVPNNRRLNEAAAQSATTPAADTQAPSTPTGGEANVPDWSMDKASDARARGYRMTNGHRVDRQEPIANKVEGNEVEVKFDKTEEPTKGKLTVVDAGSLAPSHVNGQRNINFFIDEAQPKDRTDVDSEASSNRIAEKVNPEEITGGVTAYTGSPVVNSRGEVIQGNNRTIGLQKMWGNAAYEESQKKYKQYIIDHATEFGLISAAIELMQNPVLVRMVDVDDNEAIRLGQKTAANTESGGIERIDPMRTLQAMGDNIRVFMNLLFGNAMEEQTLLSMIADNGVDVLKWLNDGRNHPKYITDTQYQSCFDRKGNLTEEAKTDIRKIVEGLLFVDAPDRLPEMFYNMPAKAQNAILATFWRDAQSPEDAKILKDIQESIEAFAVISGASEQFRNAKDVNAARTAVKDLQKQTQMFGNTATALEKFSNFALELAISYKGEKQNTIRDRFNAYYDAVQGKGGTLFAPAETKTKEQAISEVYGIETNNNTQGNGLQGSSTLGSDTENGEPGQRGSENESGVGEQVEGGEQPATSGGGGQASVLSPREQYIADHPLTVEEINASSASEAQKILARQYLDTNNQYVSEMAKAAYTYIYNKKVAAQSQTEQPQQTETRPAEEAQPETPSAPETPQNEAPENPETPTTQPTGGQNSAQAAAQAKMAAALAKLKKHGKKSDNQTDAYSVENLTPEQIEDMFEVVEAGAELGYTLLDGVQSKEEWISQMRDAIAEPLKDATGYNDAEVDELLNDMWNYPYAVDGQTKTVGEWAAEKGINVNENNNEQGESNGDNVPQSAELPAGSNVAGSTETGTVESGNNEANPESGGETGFGPLFGGVNSGTGEVGETATPTTGTTVGGGSQGNGTNNEGGNGEGGHSTRSGQNSGSKTAGRTANEGTGNTQEIGSDVGGTGISGQPSSTAGTTGKQTGGTGRTGQSGNQGGGVRGAANVNAGTGNGGGETTGTGDIGSPSMGQSERVTEKKPLADITQEKAPYKPSSIGGKFAIGSVVPSGIADAIAKAFERLKKKFKKSTLDFVREELGYKSNEELLSDFESGKTDGLASEQVDAVALAIGKMKDGKSFIVGDMTGVGKGRTAAALIRWGIKHGKKVVFITEKSGLFSDMYRDLKDIGCDYMPFVTNDDTDANITDADGNKVIPKPNSKMQAALWQSDKDELPTDKKGRKYDFVMTTYSQASNPRGVNGKRKLDWLKEYAKDAIVIMDESHNASGESNRGQYFQEIVQGASGVTFLSATYAKRPDNMLLYAIKSSMSELNMAVGDMLQAIKEYGVAMQELMASALFGSGEMIRRERDMSDVKTTWTDPKEIYSEEDYEQCRKTSDKTMAVINDIIDFQRTYIDPIVKAHEKEHDQGNTIAALTGAPQVHTSNTAYKSQVSNVVNLMTYAMKAKKAAEMAIEQIKQGKKPVIAVENTLDSYIKELPNEMDSADFGPVLEKGIAFSLRYMTATYEKGDGGYKKVKGSEQYFNAEDELDDDGLRALENLRQRVKDYLGDPEKVDLTLSPIDLIKQMIADAGYSCGEITGRGTQLVRKDGGGYKKESIKQDKKGAARKFNGGSKSKPLPENEQYQALVLNVAGATGISLHSSKTFGNQQPRTMIILQPARDVNTEVQMRGRIDRTGQVHRGEYFYLTSPIPAEQKITMMLKQKLASLDAQSVGTKEVSSNKVDSQDMDNKYGDQVCFDFLMEHLMDVNAFLENGIYQDKKTREWTYDPGLLYDVLKDLQRMPCDMQEMVISELTQRYADQIEYLNQNGINDLETTAMNLEAVTIDKATFVKGKDNESENEFAHDTAIERVEVNVLKKPMRSSDIKKKMKDLDSLDDDGLPKEGVLGQTTDKVKTVIDNLYADREAKFAEKEKKHEEKLRLDHPKKDDQTDEEYEEMIQSWPSLIEMKNKDKADLLTYGANLQEQYNNIYKAAMYLKPGRPYLVPLTDEISGDAPMMYGRFLGFQMKNGDPRQVQAVFAVKDSRAMITVPVVNKFKVIEKIINERNDMEIVALQRNPDTYEDYTIEERAKVWDEWWDKMIPKNTNRQIRYMITGNVVQACGSLGKYKGQIVTFTRKNKETGEITLERGMLLAENFDPENFKVRKAVEKKDVWDSYGEVKDDRSGISCHREGNRMVVKFEKRSGEKLVDHPAQKDETLKSLAMNGEIRPSGKKAILCVINEDNVEKALEHLYKEYGYTKEELFVMPDSTEKPDAIIRTNRPYQDIIDQYQEKYGYNQYSVDHKIKQMLKRYKMDVNNDTLKEQIREAVQLRQAYLRRDYTNQSSERLAWEVLVRDQYIEQAGDSKEDRERNMRIKEAILEELEYRGFKGKAYHYTQGKMTTDDVKKMFNEMNDITTPEGQAKKALFDRVMAKVEKLPMEIFMNEKISNDTGGFAGGRVVNYNWKYMNADYISDQAKADTILHELIHTVTAYADRCMEDGLDHLLDQDMRDAVNELHSIFETIKNDQTFVHNGHEAYGLKNVREMLSEAGSNSEFREDLKKTNLWMKLWSGILKFFGIKQNVQGARQVNAFDLIMERLDYLIDNFNQEAWDKYYQGTSYGGYGYKKMDAQKVGNEESLEAINDRFNQRLDELELDPNQKDRVLYLGHPDSFLKEAGVKNGEIIMDYDRFVKKSSENYKQNHPFSAEDIKNLPKAINAPIAVFDSTDGNENDKVILTELQRDGNNFVVVIRAKEHQRKGGVVLEVNEIQTLFPKKAKGIIKWILDDLFTLVDKEKVLRWIKALQTHPGTSISSEELNSAANIIQSTQKSKKSTDFNTSNPLEAIEQMAREWKQQKGEPPLKVNDTMKAEAIAHDVAMIPRQFGLKGGARTFAISNKDDIENLRGLISNRALRTVEKLYNEGNTGAAYLPESDIVVVFGERLSDPKEGEGAWWHEQTHGFWNTLSEDAKDKYGKVFLDYLKKNRPAMYNFIVNNYEKFDWGEEACAYFIGDTIEKYGTETFLNANFEGIEEICNFANELRDYIRNGREEENGNQVRRGRTDANGGAEVSGRGGLQGRNDQQEEGDEEVKRMITNPMDAIDRAAKSWRDERSSRMPGSPSSPGTISEKQVYENRINTAGYVTTEAYQDSMLGLKVGQNAIAHDEDIPDSQNAYQAENLAHGKTKNEQDLYKAFYQDPLVDTISMILNKTGMNWGDIDRYVFSKHGLERNRQLFVRDTLNKMEKRAKTDADKQAVKDLWNKWNACKAENYDKLQNGDITLAEYFANLTTFIKRNINSSYNPEEHDYSGFREMFGDDTGKYSEADILNEIKDAEDKMEPDLMNKLWEQINAANKYALDRYREAGMKTDEQMDEIEQMFYWYVPMRGFKDDTGEDVYQYMTSKDFRVGSTGSLLKHAKGRGSEAAFPIATMFSMANRAISDCNQNIVKQHLWRLCLAHPDNDLIVLKSCWVEKNSDDEWEVSYPPIDEKMTEAQIKDVMKTYYEDLRQKEARGEAKVIRNKEHFDYRPSSKEKKHQHIVEVMVNGEKKLMIVVGNPRLAQAINGLTRFKIGDNPIRKWNAAAKNWMSTMATTYNATFMVRNMARDWTHFTAILTTREGKGYATYANKYYWKALPKMKSLFKKYREGTLDMSKPMERDFKDFMDNGGTTGYVFMNKAEDIQKDMAKLLKKMKRGGAIKLTDSMFKKILDYVEACNEAVENCARFATYMASRNYAGRTRKRSAYDAKEVTVNFNKKGAGSKTAGFKSKNKNVERIASIAGNTAQFVGEGKMFFNATIQAIATIFKNFQNKDGSPNLPYIARFATIYAAVPFAGSIAMAAINKTLIEAAGGDDDDDPYANLPEWVRRKNICIYMGWVPGVEKIFGGDGEFGKKFFHNSFLTIPIGQEMAAFYSLGDMVAGLTINENLKPVDANVVSECVNFLNVFSPVDFESKVTNKDGLGAMPSEIVSRFSTVLAPIVAVGENVAWTGKPIFREDRFGDDERRPEYQMVYNSTNQGYVIFSKALNDISGGDDVKRGWAQVNPGTMQYIVEQYTGGPGKFISNTSSTVRDIYEAVRPDGDAQFNIRKLEMVKAFLQQSDERTQFQRTQAKYWKYKNEAKDFDYELKGYQEKAAESPYHYLQLQKHLKGPDLLRSQIIKETDKYLKDLNKLAVEGKTANDRRAARQLYNQVLKGIVDQLDKAENVAPPVED